MLVANDPKASSRHWEIYTYAGTGRFSAYLPGYEPAEVVSTKDICDRAWHHVAMTFDGKTVSLFVDGKSAVSKSVKVRAGVKPVDGPLSIGMALDGGTRVGCDGRIDEVRVSRVVRAIDKLPTAAPELDADTIALWRFDGSDRVLADPAWTPPPVAVGEPWERMTDVDWVDGRLRLMDTGPTFNATMAYKHVIGDKRMVVYKGTAIRIGDTGEGGVIFDRNQLRLAAGWTGGFLNQSDRRFGLLNTPTPKDKTTMIVSSRTGPGYAGPRGETESKHHPTAPLPQEWAHYNGLYMHGKRVVLSYSVRGVEVLESPWLETIAGQSILTRTFWIGATKTPLRVLGWPRVGGVLARGAFASGFSEAIVIPASNEPQAIRINYSGSDTSIRGAMAVREAIQASQNEDLPDIRTWTKPGPARWTKEIVTKGEVAKDTAPYVVDTLTIPYDNPHKALFFCTGLDFLPDGRIALCTCHRRRMDSLRRGREARQAHLEALRHGLYQPLGLKVVDGKIIVLERGQLTRLHEGRDGEAYFYENLCNDWHTGSGEHSYDTCLETDSKGNFYFFKTGDTELPHGGCLMRVSKDGKKVEVFATGFRHPIGLGVGPGDVVTGADQEGNWMPMTRVDVYKMGGFYGDMRAHHRAIPPKTYDAPLCWMPKEIDNSAGGQAWVPHDRFGLPKGQLLLLSYGRCKLYALLTQEVGDARQAGAVDLGVTFLSGSARARFNPKDGHLYVCGLNGWQTAAKRDGCLQRVRYTGRTLLAPTALSVHADGVRLTFPEKIDAKGIDPKRFRVEEWNYRWSGDYGSKRWSAADPKRQGGTRAPSGASPPARTAVASCCTSRGCTPSCNCGSATTSPTGDGRAIRGEIFSTINKVGGRRSERANVRRPRGVSPSCGFPAIPFRTPPSGNAYQLR